ncbi:MAG TPA: ELWxxDGT repeat protein [Thermoanaerobaculia bacterium]
MRKLCGFAVLACALALLPPPAAEAQTASLVADVNPSITSGLGDSSPSQLMAWGGEVFFLARTHNEGLEVWATDGTGAGTQMLVDACPGRCSGGEARVASVPGGAIFTLGGKLWRSDGTRPGTVPLTFAGETLAEAANPRLRAEDVAVTSQAAYFTACTPSRGCGAWRSDGSLAGTQPIGPALSGNPPLRYRAAGDRVFFLAGDNNGVQALWEIQGTGPAVRLRVLNAGALSALATTGNRAFLFQGSELWTSDGSAAGTRRLHTFRAIPTFDAWIKPAGDRVYLLADDGGAHGQQIWRSDGTPDGTRKVTDFGSSDGLSRLPPEAMGEAGDHVVFLAGGASDYKIWAVPLAAPGAAVDLCGSRCALTVLSDSLTAVGGRLLFVAADGAHGMEPWTTDGTPAGTSLLVDSCPGSCGGASNVFSAASGATTFFQAAAALWRTDGTAAGTRRYSDGSLQISTDLTDFVQAGDRVFFSAQSDDYSSPTFYGQELWTSDGRPGGTRIVTDLENRAASSYPTSFAALGDSAFFLACTDDTFGGQELWRASAAGAEALTTGSGSDCNSTSAIEQVVQAGQHLFLWRTRRTDFRSVLWATDGTAAGTVQLTTHPEDFSRGETSIVPFKDHVYWMEGDATVPNQVWTSDGTVAGTGKAFDLPDPTTPPVGVLAAGDALYVLAVTPQAQGFQVWRTDGTAAALRKVFTTGLSLNFAGFDSSGSSLALFLENASHVYELWKVDAAGGVHLHDFLGRSRDVVTYQGAFYFLNLSDVTANDFGLWRSDGTAASTTLVHRFPNPGGAEPGTMRTFATVFAGKLFFTVDDGIHGAELWSSDGTAAGTALVKDLNPGPAGSAPSDLAVAGGRLFFSADDGVHGFELWQSDGTAAGTRLVEDLAPEAASSYPTSMTAAGDRLYFAADDGLRGIEPWTLPLSGAAGCQPSPTSLCLNNGRFRVELVWRTPDGRSGAGQAVGLTVDTGYFWFFDPANVETVIKVLDGRGLNDHFWVFYGALSNVEYTLTVTDTQTGLSRHYFNPAGQFGSVGDTHGFGPLGEYSTTRSALPSPQPRITKTAGPAAPAPCQPGPTRLCLNGNRFAVEATWKDFSGHTGSGQAVSLTGDTGTFWFFSSSNVEVILKVLDGRASNGKFWVFYGALSNVEYTIQVTDTATGAVKTYTNPAGQFASVGDTDAF